MSNSQKSNLGPNALPPGTRDKLKKKKKKNHDFLYLSLRHFTLQFSTSQHGDWL